MRLRARVSSRAEAKTSLKPVSSLRETWRPRQSSVTITAFAEPVSSETTERQSPLGGQENVMHQNSQGGCKLLQDRYWLGFSLRLRIAAEAVARRASVLGVIIEAQMFRSA
jgi:hypothetical protein